MLQHQARQVASDRFNDMVGFSSLEQTFHNRVPQVVKIAAPASPPRLAEPAMPYPTCEQATRRGRVKPARRPPFALCAFVPMVLAGRSDIS
jgi:hypothetical protein